MQYARTLRELKNCKVKQWIMAMQSRAARSKWSISFSASFLASFSTSLAMQFKVWLRKMTGQLLSSGYNMRALIELKIARPKVNLKGKAINSCDAKKQGCSKWSISFSSFSASFSECSLAHFLASFLHVLGQSQFGNSIQRMTAKKDRPAYSWKIKIEMVKAPVYLTGKAGRINPKPTRRLKACLLSNLHVD